MNCLMRSPLLVPCPFSPQYAHANAKFKSLGPQSFHLKSRNLCQSRASQEDDNFSTSKVVRIRHCDLLERSADLSEELESGFGPSGLGIIAICDVPRFSVLRKSLLELSHRLAALPEEAKNDLEDPDSRYSFGWSHGKEKLVSGRPDKLKGSFYANPIVDIPTTDEALIRRYSSYLLPELEPGLTCAMYMKDDSEISCPDNTAGLYIKTRTGAIVKTAKGDKACRVERNTFALFMQPHWDEPLNFLDSIASFDKELMKSNGSMTFGDYSEQLLNKYYGPRS